MKFFQIIFFLFFLLILSSCKSIDYLYYLSAGKNLLKVDYLDGGDEINLAQLDNIELKGFSISDYHHPLVQKHIRNYQLYGDKTISIILKRANYYLPIIKKIFKEKNIPEDLAYLPIIESGFNPKALSRAGASGIWQFMYGTGIMYDLKANYWVDDRRDFIRSTYAAAYHLKYLYKKLGNWLLVLSAYNAGLGKMRRAIRKYKTKNFWKIIEGDYLAKETKNYIPKFIASVMIAKNFKKKIISAKGKSAEEIVLNLRQFEVTDATDIKLIAKLAGMSEADFKKINPALKSWATPPEVKYSVYVPRDKYNQLVSEFDKIPLESRITYRRYFINIGDNLTSISKKFSIPINPIAKINHFKSLNSIHAGSYIVLPIRGLENTSKFDKSFKKVKEKKKFNHIFLYIVQAEDTLYKIASRFKVSMTSLIKWNQLSQSKKNFIVRNGRLLIIKQ